MGQVLIADDLIHGLIRDASRCLRAARALRWASRTGAITLGLVLAEGTAARAIPLPDLELIRHTLLSLPLGAALLGWSLPPGHRAARAEAGRWIGEPALLLAVDADGASQLRPLLLSRARDLAPNAVRPARSHSQATRALPLLYLLALLFTFAPGRLEDDLRLPPASAQAARSAVHGLKADGPPPGVPAARTAALRKALRDLEKPGVSRADVEAAIAELEAAARAAGSTLSTLSAAAGEAPELRPLGLALERQDAQEALAAIRELARRLGDGDIRPSELERASEALLASATGAGSERDRRLLTAAGEAMAAGDASGLEEALVDLADAIRARERTPRELRRAAIALHEALGSPGSRAGDPTEPSTAAPLPRDGTTAPAARNAFADRNELRPRHLTLLSNYYSGR